MKDAVCVTLGMSVPTEPLAWSHGALAMEQRVGTIITLAFN